MQSLVQPRVLNAAAGAALVTMMACLPRLILWPARPAPLWLLAGVLVGTSLVLWAFVFGWHTEYTRRPVLVRALSHRDLGLATAWGVGGALLLSTLVDPALRPLTPEDYPASLKAWVAMTLFSLSLEPLFLCFAPFAFFMRLFPSPKAAAVLTVLWGLCVMYLKMDSSPVPLPAALVVELVVLRLGLAALSVYFYLRGGVWLVLYCGLWLHARHLVTLLALN